MGSDVSPCDSKQYIERNLKMKDAFEDMVLNFILFFIW